VDRSQQSQDGGGQVARSLGCELEMTYRTGQNRRCGCSGMTPERRMAPVRTLALAIALVAVMECVAAVGQVIPAARIACIPEKPIVYSGEKIGVSVFVLDPARAHLQYAWTATMGEISGTARQVTWSFQGALTGISTSTVTVTSAGRKLGECSVQVTVIKPAPSHSQLAASHAQYESRPAPQPSQESRPAPQSRITARAFLIMGAKEDAGYGLYSYLLFGSPPTDSTRPRYLKAIQAYLTLIQTVTDMRAYRSADKLNITSLPVKVRTPDSPAAEWLLENYDFARARVLLDLLSSSYQTGPYFVSTLTPLSSLQTIPHDHLFQDLSLVPADPQDLLSWWIRAFLNQTAQQQFWQPQTGELLALKLRTIIGVEATGLPEVQKQLASWIAWAK
jgi:hypothetical protein